MLKVAITQSPENPRVDCRLVRRAVRVACEVAACRPAARAVSVVFVRDGEMRRLNRRTFKRNGTTDVIAFPFLAPVSRQARSFGSFGACPETLLGEVFISVDRAEHEAKRRGIPAMHELLLYVTHGVLHLLGHDDSAPRKVARMRKMEAVVLSKVMGRSAQVAVCGGP